VFLAKKTYYIFILFQMDKEACWRATDSELKELGLIRRGDIINLKGLCIPTSSNEEPSSTKRMRLGTLIKQTANERVSKQSSRLQLKCVQMGWYNYDETKRKYVNVRSAKGGGSRKEKFPNECTAEDILEKMKELFFPNGVSALGNLSEFHTQIGSSKQDLLDSENFILQNYIKKNQFTKTYLHLMTRKKSKTALLLDSFNSTPYPTISDEDDDHLDITKFIPSPNLQTASTPKQEIPSSSFKAIKTSPVTNDVNHNLIGSSEERLQLREELDRVYESSLSADIEKERLEKLRQEREARVLPEPQLDEDIATVTIRHCTLGSKVRLFRTSDKAVQVYDWIGSLQTKPEFFKITDYKHQLISPDSTVSSGTFNMSVVDHPVPQSPSSEVAFVGFSTESTHTKLQELRKRELSKLDNEVVKHISITRDNVYQDLLSEYTKQPIQNYANVMLTFKDESAVGDGVLRDAYATFFNEMFQLWEGDSQLVPKCSVHEEELIILGKIITHAFLILDIFPVQLSKASFLYTLFGACEDEVLFQTFLGFLPEKDCNRITNFDNCSINQVSCILNEYKIFAVPNKGNIRKLCIDAANIALVKQPFFSLKLLFKEMEIFKQMNPDMISCIYEMHKATPEKVIDCLQSFAENHQESNIMSWLIRYIRNCTHEHLLEFIRYVTGSTSLPTGTLIAVKYVDQPIDYLRPVSKTCFKILFLPRQYSSYGALSKSFKVFVHSNPDCWVLYDSD